MGIVPAVHSWSVVHLKLSWYKICALFFLLKLEIYGGKSDSVFSVWHKVFYIMFMNPVDALYLCTIMELSSFLVQLS